ncbi:hypothetical protein LZ31DRAFT_547341 [Colletotrichum somersetense]|nr:hypothetical protein LZ31DRAFT_547341 [Colletotrichum somersetense]
MPRTRAHTHTHIPYGYNFWGGAEQNAGGSLPYVRAWAEMKINNQRRGKFKAKQGTDEIRARGRESERERVGLAPKLEIQQDADGRLPPHQRQGHKTTVECVDGTPGPAVVASTCRDTRFERTGLDGMWAVGYPKQRVRSQSFWRLFLRNAAWASEADDDDDSTLACGWM